MQLNFPAKTIVHWFPYLAYEGASENIVWQSGNVLCISTNDNDFGFKREHEQTCPFVLNNNQLHYAPVFLQMPWRPLIELTIMNCFINSPRDGFLH